MKGVTEIAKATSAGAVVLDLNISEAIIGDAGPTLVEAVSASSSLEFITIGKGLRLPLKDNYDSDILDAAGKGIEAGGATVIAWWLTTSAAAAVEAVVLKGNMITGSTRLGYYDAKYDNDLSGIIALCEALPGLQKPISLDLSNCGLSVKGVTEIAKATSAGAALTEVDVRGNKGLDKAAVDALRAAAPETCKILAD